MILPKATIGEERNERISRSPAESSHPNLRPKYLKRASWNMVSWNTETNVNAMHMILLTVLVPHLQATPSCLQPWTQAGLLTAPLMVPPVCFQTQALLT